VSAIGREATFIRAEKARFERLLHAQKLPFNLRNPKSWSEGLVLSG